MGGGSSKTESKTTVDPQLMALYNQNYAQAGQVADGIQYSPYGGERVAGFNPTQTNAQQGLISAANDPTGTGAIKSSMNTVGGLLNYQPQQISAGQLSNTDLTPYMNPFQKDVIDASISQNQFARGQQGVADNAAATAAHAFGGSRQGVQRANTTAAYDRNNQINLADLNTQNFTQARQGAQFDIGNRLSADQFNTNSGLAGANFRVNAATANANLGNSYLADQAQRGGILSAVGSQQQLQQQAIDDAAYEEFMRQLNAPIQAQQLRNQALGMIPMQQTQTGTTTSSPGFGGILGGIGSLGLGIASLGSGSIGGKFLGL